jgi:hypothetical protein
MQLLSHMLRPMKVGETRRKDLITSFVGGYVSIDELPFRMVLGAQIFQPINVPSL